MKFNLSVKSLKISADLVRLIGEIDEFKGAWKAYGNLAPERLTALKRVATIESVGSSNRIEGNTLTDKEVANLLDNISVQGLCSRDEQEVAGYATVMKLIFDNWEEMPITENVIKQLHKEMLDFCDFAIHHRGEYKKVENSVAAFEAGQMVGIVFRTAPPFETPELMKELVEWYQNETERRQIPQLILIGIFLVTFLAIHPFEDGNGRLSRVLTTLMMLRAGYGFLPYCSLESVIEESKQGYYAALRLTQKTLDSDSPDWEPWLKYFLKSLTWQKNRLEKKIEKEHLLRTVPQLSLQILEFARDRQTFRMADVEAFTKASRSTLRLHLLRLVKDEYLIQM